MNTKEKTKPSLKQSKVTTSSSDYKTSYRNQFEIEQEEFERRKQLESANDWEESKLKQAAILSGKGAVCRLKTSGPVTVMHKNNVVNVTKHDDGSISFPTERGESYRIGIRR